MRGSLRAQHPFHWGYEFDEILNKRGGFDAIITNPPWEIFKPNAKEFFEEYSELVAKKKMTIKEFEKEQSKLLKIPEVRKVWLEYLNRFPHVSLYFRNALQYKNQIAIVNGKKAGTDINLYKLFLEQCFNLLRTKGRCGIIVPSGIYTDLGAKQLREVLFSECELDTLIGLSNERFIFEGVHHSFKICLLTFEKGGATDSFRAAFRINPREAISPNELDRFLHNEAEQVEVSASLVRRLSPESISIMEFRSEIDVSIAKKLIRFPLLGEKIENVWNLKLTREFDMTNDSDLFKTQPSPDRLPLYEGKMIHQFDHCFSQPRYWVDEKEGREMLLGRDGDTGQRLDYQQYRVGFRSAGENTNTRNFISTIIPPYCFCGNSIILSQEVNEDQKLLLFLCAIFNGFVLDYAIRLKISRNMNMFYIYQLPLPRLTERDPEFAPIVYRAARLICTTPEFDELAREVGLGSHKEGATQATERARLRAELDGIIAYLYGLTEEEFAHILKTFPLVPEPVKIAAQNAYRDVERGLIK